jgi:hypothetical protein
MVNLKQAKADLPASERACLGYGGPLRRWGHARACDVCDAGSMPLTLRLQRARSGSCGCTDVLLFTVVLPHRADTILTARNNSEDDSRRPRQLSVRQSIATTANRNIPVG